MIQGAKWLLRRATCTIRGHRLRPKRIYYGPAASVVPGYRCGRCGHTQLLAYRWQEVFPDE